MGGLFGGKAKSAANPPQYAGVAIQTSAYGVPITIVYGTARISPNLIDYTNFKAIPHVNQSSAGKGGLFSAPVTNVTYTYQADLMFGLCEGPIAGIGAVWASQTLTSLAGLGLTSSNGANGQAIWSYWQTQYGARALAYSGLAWVGGSPYQLGDSANLPNNNFEVYGALFGSGTANGLDADPTLIAVDLLTNPYYGGFFPANRIGTLVFTSETSTVPGGIGSPFTITVSQSATFVDNKCVVDSGGNLFTPVASSPGHQQYTFANGVYTFSAADLGTSVTIRYTFLTTMFQHSSFCRASGIAFSPSYTQQQPISQLLDQIATLTYSYWIWSQGVLTMIPRSALSVSGHGINFITPQNPVVDLTDDDFLENQGSGTNGGSSSDPVIISRTPPAKQNNHLKLECLDRANQYATAIVEQTDQGLVDRFGKRSKGSQSAHLICDITVANICAQLLLQAEYGRNNYTFTLDARYAVLDVMDIVTLTQSSATLPLNRQFVRLVEITENNDGTFTFVAEEYPTGTGAAAQYSLNRGQGLIPDFNIDPGSVNPPIFYVPPLELTGSPNPEVFIAISGFSPKWAGAEVWVATQQGGPYSYVGTQYGSARMGLTTTSLAAHTDPDTVDTVGVDLTESNGALTSGTQTDADLFNTMCYVGGGAGELISYQNATLTAANKYTLGTYLRRGIYHTPITSHPAGVGFFRVDNGVFIVPIDKDQMDVTLFVKFLSFNIYGAGKQLLSSVTPYSFVPSGNPALTAVTGFSASAGLRAVALAWTNPPQRAFAGVEVFRSTSNVFSTAVLVAELGNAITAYTDGGLQPAVTYFYWIQPLDLSGNIGPLTGPVSAKTLQTATTDFGAQSIPSTAYVPGSITSTPLAAGAVSANAVANGSGLTITTQYPIFTQINAASFSLDQPSTCTIITAITWFDDNGLSSTGNKLYWQVFVDGVAITPLLNDNGALIGAFGGSPSYPAQIFLGAGGHTVTLSVTSSGTGSLTSFVTVNSSNFTVIALKR